MKKSPRFLHPLISLILCCFIAGQVSSAENRKDGKVPRDVFQLKSDKLLYQVGICPDSTLELKIACDVGCFHQSLVLQKYRYRRIDNSRIVLDSLVCDWCDDLDVKSFSDPPIDYNVKEEQTYATAFGDARIEAIGDTLTYIPNEFLFNNDFYFNSIRVLRRLDPRIESYKIEPIVNSEAAERLLNAKEVPNFQYRCMNFDAADIILGFNSDSTVDLKFRLDDGREFIDTYKLTSIDPWTIRIGEKMSSSQRADVFCGDKIHIPDISYKEGSFSLNKLWLVYFIIGDLVFQQIPADD